MTTNILGLSAFYHDSAAALLVDGVIIAAAQEERFTRRKHDAAFPAHAIAFCLGDAGISLSDLNYVVFYDKPLVKFERLLETYLSFAPRGISSFIAAIPVWLREKLFLKRLLRQGLCSIGDLKESELPRLLFNEHHHSHAASAFYPSPFESAAVLCLDGVGEWATSSVWIGDSQKLVPQWEIDFPHSLGLLYSAFTYYTGFRVNSGEYKLMGLAPYGEAVYADRIMKHLIDVKDDGTFRLNMKYFDYATGLKMTNDRFNKLFDGPPRKPESPITRKQMDIARSIQLVVEEVILKLCRTVHRETGMENLCLAGGVALNCVANGRIVKEGPFKNIWIQPAAGDAGGALGAAQTVWYEYLGRQRVVDKPDSMHGAFLGPAYKTEYIREYLDSAGAVYETLEVCELFKQVALMLEQGAVVGWFQGKMEFGPRALGARSILGDPRREKMQSLMNLKIKFRESFRPFAPAVKADKAMEWFDLGRDSPYMLVVAGVNKNKCVELLENGDSLSGFDKLQARRSQIPAVTHVDYSARVQTVHRETNPRFYDLLDEFERLTGCPVLINTSFNVRGEPVVCTPEDAYRCFMRTDMDYLVMENILLEKNRQSAWDKNDDWRAEFALD